MNAHDKEYLKENGYTEKEIIELECRQLLAENLLALGGRTDLGATPQGERK
jgi:hypothetical protein